jgi:hypothetical protein
MKYFINGLVGITLCISMSWAQSFNTTGNVELVAQATMQNDTTHVESNIAPVVEKGGPQIWAETCNRCHNAPPPSAYTDEAWEVIGKHMEIRAVIPKSEMNKVIEFLKSANGD